jgi:hypothetical protein
MFTSQERSPGMAKTFRKEEGVVSRRIAGETILVPVTNNLADLTSIFVLNTTGEFIWDHLDGSVDTEGITRLLVKSFDVEEDRASADCEALVRDLLDAGLISEA